MRASRRRRRRNQCQADSCQQEPGRQGHRPPPNESIGYVSLNNLRFEPPLPLAAGNMEYYDSGDYEDLWDLQVGYQDDDNSYEVWNDNPA